MTKIISCILDMRMSGPFPEGGDDGGAVPSLLDEDGGGYEMLNPFSLKESGEVGLRSSGRLLSFSTSLNSPVSLFRASTYPSQTVMCDFFKARSHSSVVSCSSTLYDGFLLCVGGTMAISDRATGVCCLVEAIIVDSVPDGEEDR